MQVLTLFSVVVAFLTVSPVECDAAVILALHRPQLDLDLQERHPGDPVRTVLSRLITCYGLKLVHPWQVVAQACAGSG